MCTAQPAIRLFPASCFASFFFRASVVLAPSIMSPSGRSSRHGGFLRALPRVSATKKNPPLKWLLIDAFSIPRQRRRGHCVAEMAKINLKVGAPAPGECFKRQSSWKGQYHQWGLPPTQGGSSGSLWEVRFTSFVRYVPRGEPEIFRFLFLKAIIIILRCTIPLIGVLWSRWRAAIAKENLLLYFHWRKKMQYLIWTNVCKIAFFRKNLFLDWHLFLSNTGRKMTSLFAEVQCSFANPDMR